MGDIILTSPLIDIIHKTFPLARIDFCTKERFAYLLKSNPQIHKVIKAKNELGYAALKDLRMLINMSNYNIIIDAQNNIKSVYLRYFQNAISLVFNKRSIRKKILVFFKINLLRDEKPVTERYKEIIRKYADAGELKENNIPKVYTDTVSEQSIERMLVDLGLSEKTKLICIPAVSAHFTKTYPAEYYADIINNFPEENCAFFLTGKGSDSGNIRRIKEFTKNKKVYDLCDRLEIEDLISLVKRCTIMISGDTGPMHIAEAFNIPIIMIAGSSVKEFGFYPQNKRSVVLENNNLKCRPCSHIGRANCPKGHFKCMKEITPEIVISKIRTIL